MIKKLVSVPLACVALSALPATVALAQVRTADFHWEGAVAAGGEVSIHNVNGDVKVTPSSTGRVEVIGTKHGSGREITAEVHQTSRGLVVCVVFQDAETRCDEDGYSSNSHGNRNNNWNDVSMDLSITVPANLMVAASSVSGDVDITGAQGDVSGHSVSGDVRMMHLRATSVEANSVSGDIEVQIDELTGRGNLAFRTVSGDVDITVPRQFDADISMSTVSGTMDSDYAMTLTNGRTSRRNIEARIGAGGRRLELNTVSGDVKIKSNR